MKSMFSMGFAPDLFGSRAPSPMLGQVPIRGMQPSMGQLTTKEDGDALLRQMSAADNQMSAANAWVSAHPNLQAALGADYEPFQHNMGIVSDTVSTETNVAMALQSTPPGGQYSISESDHQAVQDYIAAAAAITAAIARAGARGVPAGAVPPKTAVTTKNDLTTPLLVGGGILTIGLVALLARA